MLLAALILAPSVCVCVSTERLLPKGDQLLGGRRTEALRWDGAAGASSLWDSSTTSPSGLADHHSGPAGGGLWGL